MQNKKEEKAERKGQGSIHGLIVCCMCGMEVKPDECSWEEDGEGAMVCPGCTAEKESCGCSD